MAVVVLSQWEIDTEIKSKQQDGWEVERNLREEIKFVFARDSVWAWWRAWWHSVSVITWVYVRERFQPRRTWHTHSNACQEATHARHRDSARPWHTEHGEEISSSGDRSVPPCHMSVTISHSHVSPSHFPSPWLPFLLIIWICKANHLCFRCTHSTNQSPEACICDNKLHSWIINIWCPQSYYLMFIRCQKALHIIYSYINELNSFFTFNNIRQSSDVEMMPVGDIAKCNLFPCRPLFSVPTTMDWQAYLQMFLVVSLGVFKTSCKYLITSLYCFVPTGKVNKRHTLTGVLNKLRSVGGFQK